VSRGGYSRRGLLEAAAVADDAGAAGVEFARRHPFDPVPAAVRRGATAPPVPQNAVRDGVREVDYIVVGTGTGTGTGAGGGPVAAALAEAGYQVLALDAGPERPLLVQVDAVGCPGARHAIDNEAWPVGRDVLTAAGAYLDGVLSTRPRPVSPCGLPAVRGRLPARGSGTVSRRASEHRRPLAAELGVQERSEPQGDPRGAR